MKIVVKKKFKSLSPFTSQELSDLTVITGKNGSGKSQLLDLLSNRHNSSPPEDNSYIWDYDRKLDKIQYEGIVYTDTKQIDHSAWRGKMDQIKSRFKALSPSAIRLYALINEHNIESRLEDRNSDNLMIDTAEYRGIICEFFNQLYQGNSNLKPELVNANHEKQVLNQFIEFSGRTFYTSLQYISETAGVDIEKLSDADFYNIPLPEQYIQNIALFSGNLNWAFYNYAVRRQQNRVLYGYKLSESEQNNSVSDDDFVEKYPPPWKVINETFDSLGIDFYFKEIERREFSIDVPFELKLYKKSTSNHVGMHDLSSGEKIIIGLIIKLFTCEYYEKNLSLPEVILLDEPDAHLHPEMSQLLLDVLEKVFVSRFKIKVIVTTHSPSTIALTPEHCIYRLRNSPETSLTSISKDDALEMLTSFIPTLSIDYKNHRQVFVESPTDLEYYQVIHDRHQRDHKLAYRLYFISNSLGQGNCDSVIRIVANLRESGNKTSYGIIDWDLMHNSNNYVIVHGWNERYSIENFLLDPIYIICKLIDLNVGDVQRGIGVDHSFNHFNIGTEDNSWLQKIVDYFFERFGEHNRTYKAKSGQERIDVEYLNGKVLSMPKFYLQARGHDLIPMIKKAFPAFNKYNSEVLLAKDMSRLIAKCYPFVPKSTILTIEALCS
ncbi:AAA ATPase domain-containing protein [Catalinimonas alkaloidigena]|uniref:AAA ATPase domain-containing protein n=1 Tax=Catalinimonas alkaloidigena TaxID=1075417 RepID=A0A1G9AJT9_9BACT|nr:AAA family ATPase [Catalinimonas alkaloidigena]SDK27551.1 AAA ATPase domain-containing protein [Catalinimonas alkaloidigena]